MAVKKLESGLWQADFRPNGRGGRRFRKQFKAKADAVRYEAYVRAKITEKPLWAPPKKDGRTLTDLVNTWFNNHGRNLKDGASRKQKLLALAEMAGNPAAKEINESWYTELRNKRLEEGSSFSTVNHDLAYLRAVFNELARIGEWDGENPIKNIRKLKEEATELAYLAAEDIKVILEKLDTPETRDCYLITKICLSTGARWSEAENLRIESVKNGLIAFTSTKNGKNRYIPISQSLESEIKEYADKKRGRIFQRGYEKISRVLRECKISLPKGQRTHVFRHTFASHFMINGGNILVLQKILDHASLQMTMRYAHLAPEHLAEAKEKNPLEYKAPSAQAQRQSS